METISHGVLYILGIGVFGGLIGGYVFQKLRIPQVVGYIFIGVLLGELGLGVVESADVERLSLFNYFALGIIGFLVGGELRFADFKKYARQFTAILIGEGMAAFLIVGAASTLVIHAVTPSWALAMSGGVVFGAIASATDPASTMDVLWEYRSRGVLTLALVAVVALDDALAMTLYGLGKGLAQILSGGDAELGHEMLTVGKELFGAVGLGILFAAVLAAMLKVVDHLERGLAIAISLILLMLSVVIAFNMDVILASMTMGMVLANMSPRRSEPLFKLTRDVSIPIYVLFFVLVGARLGLSRMPGWLWLVVVVYVVGRSAGKMVGAWIGAKITRSDPVIRKYLGMGLFAQGGVAIGLSIMASQNLNGIMLEGGMSLGDAVVCGVTATTMIVQLLGPAMVKMAIKLAGESGKNVTDEDILDSLVLGDVINPDPVALHDDIPLDSALEIIKNNLQTLYPVLDSRNRLVGAIGLESIRGVINDHESWRWLLVSDVMSDDFDRATVDQSVKDTYHRMRNMSLEQILVVNDDSHELAGIIDARRITRELNSRLIDVEPEIITA